MLNKVTLIGNVGQDPEIRSTSDGKELANFSLATSESWKDKNTGEKKEKTEWHKIVVFNEGITSLVKQYVKKGAKLYIEGQLATRKWVDKDGIEKYSTEVVLQNFGSTLKLLGDSSERHVATSSDQENKPGITTTSNGRYAIDEKKKSLPEAKIYDDGIPF